MKKVWATALLAVVLVAGCSSAKKSAGSDSTSTGTASSDTASASSESTGRSTGDADLKSKLLDVSDLPTGWTVDNSDDDSDTDEPECFKTAGDGAENGQGAEVSFVGSQVGIPFLAETIGGFDSSGAAHDSFLSVTKGLDSCTTVDFDSDGTQFSGTLGAMSFPKVGDESKAYSLVLTAEGVTIGFDVLCVRVGKVDGLVLLGDVGAVAADKFKPFVDKAVDKLNG